MKREFLKELGLEKEVIDKIMEVNGKDIEKEKGAAIEKEKEIELLKGQIKDANSQIKSYKDMDIEKIQKSLKDYEEKYTQQKKEYENYKNSVRLEKALKETNSKDVDVLKKLIDLEKIKFKDDKIEGLDEQLKEIKEQKAFLFEEENDNSNSNDDRFSPYVPENSTGRMTGTMEETITSIFKS